MKNQSIDEQNAFTGRIQASPAQLMHEEILKPQFDYELQYLFQWYITIEKAFVLEYRRMELIENEPSKEIADILKKITRQEIAADPNSNMSDISFAIEQYIDKNLKRDIYAWHVDRSRNDFQACAQVMFGREQLFETIQRISELAEAVYELAKKTTGIPMPGYTHYQAAQIISPGFYLSALHEQLVDILKRLLYVYDGINKCPLGAGAMAGQALDWDRHRLAELLGFSEPQRHALVAVASRDWLVRTAGELSNLSATLSRFVSDLIMWGSSEYRFIELPDHLAGISSAMPQKKNYPILERIRGKTAHITSFYLDFLTGQRSTAFTNLVEVSKEAGTHAINLFKGMQTLLKLLTMVIENLQFKEEQMLAACDREYMGGFTLANLLTLHEKIPYRKAQVIAGRYIKAAIDKKLTPSRSDPRMLASICREYGYQAGLDAEMLRDALDTMGNLYSKKSYGSTAPNAVNQMLKEQHAEFQQIINEWNERRLHVTKAFEKLQALL